MNIELHGFLPEHAEGIGEQVWSKLQANLSKGEFMDSAVTVVGDRSFDYTYRNAPFFRVFSDKTSDFDLACRLLKPVRMPGAGMKTFVECVRLADCRQL